VQLCSVRSVSERSSCTSNASSYLERNDQLHCESLLNQGQWLDHEFTNWQPEGAFHSPRDSILVVLTLIQDV
jgi:hypothetical protein